MENKSKLFKKIIVVFFCTVMLWGIAAIADYIMVIGLYKKPLFCFSANADETGGIFNGVGYSYIIKGNFGRGPNTDFDPYGVHYAKLEVFGIEAKCIHRDVHK